MKTLQFTQLAENDFAGILEFGITRFGIHQAELYIQKLSRHFEYLLESPLIAPSAEEFLLGYRRSVIGQHSVYYRVTDSGILIGRILGRQSPDPQILFPDS